MSEGSFLEKTRWHNLPNAMHIDRVLASVKAHPEAWSAAWTTSRDAALGATRNVAGNAAWNAVPGAIAALIAWDHSIKYLDMAGEELQVWAILSDDPACILLLPAVIAFENINELEVA